MTKNSFFSKISSFSQGLNSKFIIAMTMLYSFHENLELNEADMQSEVFPSQISGQTDRREVHLFAEKLTVPRYNGHILRPRLNQMLQKSSRQFGSTLILGRSGTGKTALVSEFARQYQKVAWYSIESADNSWEVFARYFASSFNEPLIKGELLEESILTSEPTDLEVSYFIESLFFRLGVFDSKIPRLIVLDNAHYIFDTSWFNTFCSTLINCLTHGTYLLLISRSDPPLPIWRMRSKQVLGVINEKMMAFNLGETKKLFEDYGLPEAEAEKAYKKSFGRISRLKEFAEAG
jgi:ATP/maltotriose-dependent transcriptional regulator MalT